MRFLLFAYFAFVLVIAGFAVAAFYHVRKFRYRGDRTGLAAAAYLIALVSIFVISLVFIAGTDWSGT